MNTGWRRLRREEWHSRPPDVLFADDSRIALCLSGGGFRAAFFHLGVIRFLRDIGALGMVTDVFSVSGGSIVAGHLALRWSDYCGPKIGPGISPGGDQASWWRIPKNSQFGLVFVESDSSVTRM
jgi:hypothetical protein